MSKEKPMTKEQLLKDNLGFKKICPDPKEKDCWYIERYVDHPLLKGVSIMVDTRINVYCKMVVENLKKVKHSECQDMIMSLDLTSENMVKVINFLKTNPNE